ncbi:NAD(+)/NADH kinase [Natronolimnohabitans innermongolicus]|uniref:ATP-NAD/AcoX kinase n=1 Tax=Natronolimnohabitans innermongolicus JCM 12255 TaxID=1227499 RepID=L9XI50_9EURY|nr:NAD(+)/NADH kinase [Natronolimnohabitans innermongolicus]ELY61071.1 ATP-NAD/AcoX kinase [Natronolimnohabitans innermongolicus JCM 12255]
MDAAWSDAEEPLVGIVTDDESSPTITTREADALESTLRAHDARSVRGSRSDVLAADPSLLVAGGEPALSALARAGPDAPVLPVGDVDGIETVRADRAPAALESLLAIEGRSDCNFVRHPILGLEIERGGGSDAGDSNPERGDSDDAYRALFDVTLVTDQPARISEFAVASRGEPVETVRADGIVAATPAGSHGYASAISGPQLSTAVDAVVVAPIAPFVTNASRWVLPDESLSLSVERDECEIAVVADDRLLETVGLGSRVSLDVDGTLSTVVPSASDD